MGTGSIDVLSIADAIQNNLKNLAKLKNDASMKTVYRVICGQVETLVANIEDDHSKVVSEILNILNEYSIELDDEIYRAITNVEIYR